jgi:hypothetical protein
VIDVQAGPSTMRQLSGDTGRTRWTVGMGCWKRWREKRRGDNGVLERFNKRTGRVT